MHFSCVANAPAGDLNDTPGDNFSEWIVAVRKTQIAQQLFVSMAHGFDRLGLERGLLQKAIKGQFLIFS